MMLLVVKILRAVNPLCRKTPRSLERLRMRQGTTAADRAGGAGGI